VHLVVLCVTKKKKKVTDAEIEKELAKIGARLKNLRKAKGVSRAELFAYEIDMASAQYTRYERGEDMYVSTLVRLIKEHKLSFQDFFGKEFDEKK
jgi:transcriptional regulator with XRE-family HTH domain